MKRSLGDLVPMPLPTEYGPGGSSAGVPPGGPAGISWPESPAYPGSHAYANVPNPNDFPASVPPGGPTQAIPFLRGPVDTPWTPQPVLPDWALPLPLQRTNPLLRRTYFVPNRWDASIRQEAMLWQWIAAHGGLKSCCRIPELGAPVYEQPPWEVMPSQGQEYKEFFALSSNAISGGPPFNGTDTILGRFRVPIGYDGVLNRFVCTFTGGAFDDFSGEIQWRVRVGVRYARNLGRITNTFGSFQNALLVPGYGIRLISGQTVTLIASIPNASPITAGQVAAGCFGWFYPRR